MLYQGGFANTGTLPAGTGGSNIQANNTPAGLTRNPGTLIISLNTFSIILDLSTYPQKMPNLPNGGKKGKKSLSWQRPLMGDSLYF